MVPAKGAGDDTNHPVPARAAGNRIIAATPQGSIAVKTKQHTGRFSRFIRADEAAFVVDYAVLVGVVTAAVIVASVAFSGNIERLIRIIGG